MRTNAPKKITLLIAVILAALGLIGYLVPTAIITLGVYCFWLLFAGFVVLVAGNILKGF